MNDYVVRLLARIAAIEAEIAKRRAELRFGP
jgi:hypothetical protein